MVITIVYLRGLTREAHCIYVNGIKDFISYYSRQVFCPSGRVHNPNKGSGTGIEGVSVGKRSTDNDRQTANDNGTSKNTKQVCTPLPRDRVGEASTSKAEGEVSFSILACILGY